MRTVISAALLLIVLQDSAQDTTWRRSGIAAVNISQVALRNWAAGGQSSVAGNTIISYSANYAYRDIAWDNFLDLAYGAVLQEGASRLAKTEDKMELTSKAGRRAFDKIYYSGLFNFRSQFAPGYDPPDGERYSSNFLAPGYFTLAAGLDYKPDAYFSVFLSPAAARAVVVSDKMLSDAGAFGVDRGEQVRFEAGAYFKAIFKKDLSPAINLYTTLDLFSDYLRQPENIDVNFQLLLAVKVSGFISFTVSSQLLYDHDTLLTFYKSDGKTIDRVSPGLQLKEVAGVGFSYKFSGVSVR